MAYQKILVDNVVCSRRYHLTYDDEAKKLPHVKVKCKACGMVIFSADQHPPVKLARDENLVQTAELSEHIVRKCDMIDVMSEKTQHKADKSDFHVYPKS